MRFQKQAIKIFHFCYSNVFNHDITEEHFLECFKEIKNKKDLAELVVDFQSVTSRDLTDVLKMLPKETIKKVDEILFLNSLNFFSKFLYKAYKKIKNLINKNKDVKEAI